MKYLLLISLCLQSTAFASFKDFWCTILNREVANQSQYKGLFFKYIEFEKNGEKFIRMEKKLAEKELHGNSPYSEAGDVQAMMSMYPKIMQALGYDLIKAENIVDFPIFIRPTVETLSQRIERFNKEAKSAIAMQPELIPNGDASSLQFMDAFIKKKFVVGKPSANAQDGHLFLHDTGVHGFGYMSLPSLVVQRGAASFAAIKLILENRKLMANKLFAQFVRGYLDRRVALVDSSTALVARALIYEKLEESVNPFQKTKKEIFEGAWVQISGESPKEIFQNLKTNRSFFQYREKPNYQLNKVELDELEKIEETAKESIFKNEYHYSQHDFYLNKEAFLKIFQHVENIFKE